jgi:beta-N-acetylhexosaminidase
VDLILCSARDVAQGQQAAGALSAAYTGKTLSNTDFQAAVQRIIDLRYSLGS